LALPPVLELRDLAVAYRQGNEWLEAVRDVSLAIRPGQTYGLVGESGSGKSTIALAIMRYLPANGRVTAGAIDFAGRDLLALSRPAMQAIWGAELALVPQDPLSALNPSIRVGEQLAEGLRRHRRLGRPAARAHALTWLRRVRLADPERVAAAYPHQISGGMQQRIMIALALSLEPRLLVLDEPTTNLDVTTQASILDLLAELVQERQTASLYVSHNLGVVAQICDRVAVMYAGELVEDGPAAGLFRQPLHPYTQGLLDSIPRPGRNKASGELRAIAGSPPGLDERVAGCVFAPRCPLAVEICRQRPALEELAGGRRVRCHRWPEIQAGLVSARQPEIIASASPGPPAGDRTPVLRLEEIAVHFRLGRSPLQFLRRRPPRRLRAVDGITLDVPAAMTVGLVGESGSGKTTLSRAVVGLGEPTGGRMELLDLPLPARLSQRDLETLRHLQLVFQNPEEALNPHLTVGESLRRPLITLLGRSARQADAGVAGLLAAVRLPAAYAGRLPGQLSGGEKQRVAIARAFAATPSLLVADEPVSSLDVSVQASILNLLDDLQRARGTAMLFISHDLAVVGYIADVIAVTYLGRLMEISAAADLFRPPYHPYTEALLSAIPAVQTAGRQEPIRLEGDIPSPADVPGGCPFHTRCPRFLGDICVRETPPWQAGGQLKRIFCHIPLAELARSQSSAAE
jgi:peptide/nickel transport system ATP-binding protein